MKYRNFQRFDMLFFVAIALLILLLALSARAQNMEDKLSESISTSGGTFTLEKASVAGGGSRMQNAAISQNGTTGQTIAGYRSTGGSFSLYSGFWTPDAFAPTAANVIAGGRIKTFDGRGIKNVRVTITFPTGETRATLSSSFGYYLFTDIPAGEIYIFSVSAKRYVFSEPTSVRQLSEDAQDIDFIAAAPPDLAVGEAQP